MKRHPGSAERRAMKEREVILKAIAGEIKWIQAADILRVTARSHHGRSGRSPAWPYPHMVQLNDKQKPKKSNRTFNVL